VTRPRSDRTHAVVAERADGRRTVFSTYASESEAELVARQLRAHGLGAAVQPVASLADATPGATVRAVA
jgi:hypothetical protein